MKTGTPILLITVCGAAAIFTYFTLNNQSGTAVEPTASLPLPEAQSTHEKAVLTQAQLHALKVMSKEIEADIQSESSFVLSENDIEISEYERELEHALLTEDGSPWTIDDTRPSSSSIILNEKIQTKEAITFNPEESAAVSVGDVISLSLPGNDTYRAVVDYVRMSANGETNWSGYIEGEHTDYPVIFTIGTTNSFATITTPKGLYAMESVNSSGWVYKTPDLVDLVDPDQPDHLIVEQ